MSGALTFAQLKTLWLDTAKGTQYDTAAWANLMAAIAIAESAGNPTAQNDSDNGGKQTSWGLWQISLGNHDAPNPNWSTPSVNAQLALQKLQTQGLDAWGTYTSGAYEKFLNGANTPVVGQATLTGVDWNPLSWTEEPIKGLEWAGKFAIGDLNPITSTVQGIAAIASSATKLVGALNKFTALFLLLFRPQFWLRVLSGFVGFLALGAGLYFLKESL